MFYQKNAEPGAWRTDAPIDETDDDPLYQSSIELHPGLLVPLSDGWYRVELHFADIFDDPIPPFNILFENSIVIDNLDIRNAAGGPNRAVVLEAVVLVHNGVLELRSETGGALAALSIWETVAPPPEPDTQPPVATMEFTPPVNVDDLLTVNVFIRDDEGLETITVGSDDVVFGRHPIDIVDAQLELVGDQALLSYALRPMAPWSGRTVELSIPGGSVEDLSGNPISATQFTVPLPIRPGHYLIAATNAGGEEYIDTTGVVFGPGNDGLRYATEGAIAGTEDAALYQTESYGADGFSYEVPVVDGEYNIQLHFAEIFPPAARPGARRFNVSVEGQPLRAPLDIVAEAGAAFRALTLDASASVTDGALTLSFSPVVQEPKLSAFSVWSDTEPVVSAPPPGAATDLFYRGDIRPLLDLSDPLAGRGVARLSITPGSDVQFSNFQSGSFELENTGTRRIAAVFIDVSTALFPDSVFDDDGSGGDDVAKPIDFDSVGRTDPVRQSQYPSLHFPARSDTFVANVPYDPGVIDRLFVNAVANNGLASPSAGGGYRAALLLFNDFTPGKIATFSGDMDPNSIAGLTRLSASRDSNPVGQSRPFDVGGISGAELAGSTVTVLFGDGTQASSPLVPDGTQSGAIAVVDTGLLPVTTSLTVNGVAPGDTGTYGITRPSVEVAGAPGTRVRVTMVKGLNPVENEESLGPVSIRALVATRLALQHPSFPVNNAVQWQHHEIQLDATGLADLGDVFDYAHIDGIAGADDFLGDDTLPLAFVVVAINQDGNPIGPLSAPIYLLNVGGPVDD
ncbi:MAG: malectin domain-containing carbohydrate-binding protein [Myxococcota bacterium]